MNNQISPYAWPGMIEKPRTSPPTSDEVIEAVCLYYQMARVTLMRRVRHRHLVQRRYICWLLIKELSRRYTLAEMGKMFGKYDHTTVIHGLQSIANDVAQNEVLRMDVDRIKELIKSTSTLKKHLTTTA